MRISALTWLSFCLLALLSTSALANSSIFLPKGSFDYTISPYISIYEDEHRELTIDDIVSLKYQLFFSPNHAQSLKLGISNSNFWFRFSITNPYEKPIESIFTLSDSDFDLVNIYQLDSQGGYQEITADDSRRSIRGGMMQFFTLQITAPPESTTTYLIQLHSLGLLTTHIALMSQDHFLKNEQHFFTVQGVVVGFFLMSCWGFLYTWRRFHLAISAYGMALSSIAIVYILANLGFLRIFTGIGGFAADKLAELSLATLYLLHIAAANSLTWRGPHKKFIRSSIYAIAFSALPLAAFIVIFFSQAAMPTIALLLVTSSLITALITSFCKSTTPSSQRWLQFSYYIMAVSVFILILTSYNLLAFDRFSAWGELIIPTALVISMVGATVYQLPSYKIAQQPKLLDGLDGDILAQLGQELLTPVNSIAGINNLLVDTPLSPQQRDLSLTLQQASTELLHIVQQVSDLGLLQNNQLELQPTSCNLVELTSGILHELQGISIHKQIEVILDIDSDIPSQLALDPIRLHSVLFNILQQAITYSGHGVLKVKLSRYNNKDSSGVRIQLHLPNITVRPEALRNSFKIMQHQVKQLARPLKHQWHLYLTRTLLKKFDAALEVESMTASGASINLTLPFTEEVTIATSNQDKPLYLDRLNGRSALIVDDSSSLRSMLVTQIKRWGVKSSSTYNAKETLAMLRTQSNLGTPYDFIIIDHDAPILDGMDLAERIQTDENIIHKPKILLLSNLSILSIKEDAQAAGVALLLSKPVNTEHLLQALLELAAEAPEE